HEYIFLLSKSPRYYFQQQLEPAAWAGRHDTFSKGGPKDMAGGAHERWRRGDKGEYLRNKRSVWTVTTKPFNGRTLRHLPSRPHRALHPRRSTSCRCRTRPISRKRHDGNGRQEARAAVRRHRTQSRICEDGTSAS